MQTNKKDEWGAFNAMKTLYEACKVRASVFDDNQRDDTLDLSNLIGDSMDAKRFFEETFITDGMKQLFDTSFKRFKGESSNGIIKLTQAMGGGKTHNMVALGMLAKNQDVRKSVLGGVYSEVASDINVVSYTGRESDLTYGIWGEIAKQLGKEEVFAPYYSPLKAPGQSAWINLLKSDTPTLIMLDELPPYLVYCKTQTYGTGTLLDITTTALSNLFNALNKEELHNVCLVISDLKATYEQGSQIIQGIFDNLENEVNRSAINIEPVGANTDDLYNILRTRLFTSVATKEQVDEIAFAYQAAVKEAKEMHLTDENPSDIAKGIRASYPFHPSIRDLFARFKENQGFQQTRGFIRLTRLMIRGLYSEGGLSHKRYLINAYDINLNDRNMSTFIKSIRQEISNAISHDIASGGDAVAEHIDSQSKTTDMQDVAKLILVSSLSGVTGSVIGLTFNEVIAYIAEPGRDITDITKLLDEFKTRAWHLYIDNEKRLYFRKVQNVNARLNEEIRGFTYDQAKLHIRELLKEKLKPMLGDCYKEVLVFPSIEEIELKRDSVTLIVTEPRIDSKGLNEDLLKFYSDNTLKNRVMFLTGQRLAMESLVEITKQYKAIENIIFRMTHEDKVDARDGELIQAKDLHDKISAKLYSNMREAFVTLYYPKKSGLESKDLRMEFASNQFNAEEQIIKVLESEAKYTKDIEPQRLKPRFESRIFTQQRMTWNHILERCATETSWPWHKMSALNDLKNDCLKKGLWIEEGGYIDKEPPAPQTSVNVIETHRDKDTGEVTLKINPINGDVVCFEINGDATTASMAVKDLSSFKTKELKLSFICVDSTGKNSTGDLFRWTNQILIKHRLFDKDSKKWMELKVLPENIEMRYTTDGSNPKEVGGLYSEPFAIPEGSKFVQAIAFNKDKDVFSDTLSIKVETAEFVIDQEKPVKLNEPLMPTSTSETFHLFESLKELNTRLKGVNITIQEKGGQGFMMLSLGEFEIENVEDIITEMNQLGDKFFKDKKYEATATINKVEFLTGKDFAQWVAQQKKTIIEYKGKISQ